MKELINIQAELNAPKKRYNTFGNYNYRSAEDILEAVKPLLAKNDCLLTLSDEVGMIGNHFYIIATATITNKDGKSVSVKAYAREEETKRGMDASQITGSCSSFARKFALNGLFLIDDTKDADTDEQRKQAQNMHGKDNTERPQFSEEKKALILSDIKTKTTRDEMKKLWNDCKDLQKEEWFMQAVTAQGKTIGKAN